MMLVTKNPQPPTKNFFRVQTRRLADPFESLTRWLLAYGIFVLRFRPKNQQFSVALPTL